MDRFFSLGVITGKEITDKDKVEKFLKNLNMIFDKLETTKEEVVNIIKEYLPNFEHIETGKSLDSKM
jgi:ABC-type Fe2+-enterobactin transport system substrate-binding protein